MSSLTLFAALLLAAAVTFSDLQLTSATAGHSEVELLGSGLVEKRALHLCGGELVNALVSVCYQRRRRRSGSGVTQMSSWLELPSDDVISTSDVISLRQRLLKGLFTPHSQERRLFSADSRYKRGDGIVEQCCFRGCEMSTLLMYC
ncbi:uncharacterized protein LOC122390238 [Amphibalanus amphitrite]|uniref:uncharacterized protein LOC122390238 n=1 Tax=Amphibalanus amphitrite TaxID=1232801 RepID=UPI001C912136|nr:uncharacterized protein LOC122390238 [Amphibalanus amphitrite]